MSEEKTSILEIMGKILRLEASIEEAIATEKDLKRRQGLLDAYKERDIEKLRVLLSSVD